MNRLGMVSAFSLFIIGVAYLVVVTFGIYKTGLEEPITGPILSLMELLTLLSAPVLVTVWVAINATTPSERKIWSTTALCFAVLGAGITSSVHFVGLTALRQTGDQGISWPSPLYAVELLAWDVFVGLALIATSFAYLGKGLKRLIRRGSFVVGIFCLAGVLGPITGNMQLQFLSVIGYGILLPALWLGLGIDFRNSDRNFSA